MFDHGPSRTGEVDDGDEGGGGREGGEREGVRLAEDGGDCGDAGVDEAFDAELCFVELFELFKAGGGGGGHGWWFGGGEVKRNGEG